MIPADDGTCNMISVAEPVLFGRSWFKGLAPAPPEIKPTKFSMIFSSLVPTLMKGYLKDEYRYLKINDIFLVRKEESSKKK